jgi:TolB-like protein/Flp pilus assembly protein TadD
MRLSPGARVGPYEIRRLLGAGGMGEVYCAHDLRLGRDVAIKVLPESVSSDRDRLRRFEREARAAAALNHPSILAVYDVGSYHGSPYLVSELLEGETLRERLRTGVFTAEKALEVAGPLAQALAAAHERGIVHRDVKPENVFLTRDGHVKVLDFGLAKLRPGPEQMGEDSPTNTRSTASGTVLGTVSYMPPEQLRGQATDARSDVFSFGVVLYEMLAGRRPFRGESGADVMAAILHQSPAKLVDLDVAVSPQLERIIERCVQKRPEDRFDSAHELVVALEAVSGAESAGRPALSGAMARVLRGWARRRWGPVTALVLLAIGAAVGWGIWRSRSGTRGGGAPITSLAVLPLKNYSGDASQDFLADGMTDALIADLAQIRALRVISRTSMMQYRDTKKAAPEIARELGVEGILEGSVVRLGSRVRVTAQLIDARRDRHLWASNYEREMRDVLALQREVVSAISGEIRVQVTPQEKERLAVQRTVAPDAYEAALKARVLLEHATTEKEIRSAVELFRRATQQDPLYAPAWAGLAEATWWLAGVGFEFVPPGSVRDEARRAAERALELDDLLPEAHNARAVIAYDAEWDLEAAERHYRRALELRPGYAAAHNNYGQMLFNFTNRFAEAREHLQMARGLDPFSPWNDINGCGILHYERRFDRAIEECGRALARSPGNFVLHWIEGQDFLARGEPDRAVAAFEAMIEPSGRNLNFLAHLALAYGRAGRREDARRILHELRDLSKVRYVSPVQLAFAHLGLGERDEAFRLLDRAVDERTPLLATMWSADPIFDVFRGDARYEQIRARLRLLVKPMTGAAGTRS